MDYGIITLIITFLGVVYNNKNPRNSIRGLKAPFISSFTLTLQITFLLESTKPTTVAVLKYFISLCEPKKSFLCTKECGLLD